MSPSTKPRRNNLPAGPQSTPTLTPDTTRTRTHTFRERARVHNARRATRSGALTVVRLTSTIARDILAGLRVLADAFQDSVRHRQGWEQTR